MKKKILLVFTGGTIGSTTKSHTTNVNSSAGYRLLEEYGRLTGCNSDIFDIYAPLSILSENLVPADWAVLVDFIKAKPLDAYSGVIVTHGTDTLPYTSAVLSYAFNDLDIPLVVVSSNYPLGSPDSNGLNNFAAAVHFIEDAGANGVFVTYQDSMGEQIVHLGTRLTEASPFTHQFRSQKDAYFGKIVDKKFVHNSASPYGPSVKELLDRAAFTYDKLAFSNRVLCVKPYPGLNYTLFDFSVARPSAVLHGLYHSGTACMRLPNGGDANYSLLSFARRCKDENIDFYAAPLSMNSGNLYVTTREFLDSAVIPMLDMTMEAAIAKLSIAYGSFCDRWTIQEFLQRNIFFDSII